LTQTRISTKAPITLNSNPQNWNQENFSTEQRPLSYFPNDFQEEFQDKKELKTGFGAIRNPEGSSSTSTSIDHKPSGGLSFLSSYGERYGWSEYPSRNKPSPLDNLERGQSQFKATVRPWISHEAAKPYWEEISIAKGQKVIPKETYGKWTSGDMKLVSVPFT